MANEESLICIGQIIKPHGVYGEMKADLQFPSVFKIEDLIGLEVQIEGFEKKLVVEEAIWLNKQALISFEGIESIDEANELRGKKLFLKETQLGELPKDEFYIKDLIGLTCINKQTQENIGKIIDFLDIPGNPLLKIEISDGRKFLLPLTESYVGEINLGNKIIELIDWEIFAE